MVYFSSTMKKQVNQLFTAALFFTALIFNFGCRDDNNTVVDNFPIPSPGLPIISSLTFPDDSVGFNIAQGEATIISNGGTPILAYGLCWSKNPNPTVTLGTKTKTDVNDDLTNSKFKHYLTLEPQTRYYVRAYVINKTGIDYSDNEKVFVTKPTLAIDRDLILNKINPEKSIYKAIQIGNQVWTSVNLSVGTYRDDSLRGITKGITLIKNPGTDWSSAISGAMGSYANDEDVNRNLFGRLYNFYTIANPLGLCPAGWHLPSVAEWDVLIQNSGGTNMAGKNLKGATLSHITSASANPEKQWQNQENIINNFRATPGGFRSGEDGTYKNLGLEGTFWTSDPVSETEAYSISIKNNDPIILNSVISNKKNGHSVRCIWDGNPK